MKYLLYVLTCLLAIPTITSAQSPNSGDNNLAVKVSDKNNGVENVLIANWNDAKTKYKWDWLETSKNDEKSYRYFSDNKLMVVCKAPELAWTQTDLPYNPLPTSWSFEATFSNVKGKSENCETGLLLKATSNGEEVKVFFVVNHFNQT